MKSGLAIATFACLLASGAAQARPSASDAALAKDVLKRSISMRTVAGQGQVPALAAYYAGVLKDAGFADGDIEITPMGETATLAVTLKGRDPKLKPIALLGHMDVVEAKAADWDRDPFVPVEENGYIFGRGSEDNKYDIAMMVAALARLKREGYAPRRSIILLLSGDEETAMVTTRALASKYRGVEMVLNGDGGGGTLGEDGKANYYALQAGEKTYADFTIEYTNPGGHSSRPGKLNAIYQLAGALERIGAYRFPAQSNELTRAALSIAATKVSPDLADAMRRFVKDPNDQQAAATIASDPEYVGQVGTTCVTTMVNGGHAQNALPQRAVANVNCRIFPGVSVESVRETIVRVINDPSATVKVDGDPVASDASPLRPDLMKAVTRAVQTRYPGVPVIPAMSAGATDSVHFRALGVPSYGVASLFSKPSDSYAHGLNERVPVAGIGDAVGQWYDVLKSVAS